MLKSSKDPIVGISIIMLLPGALTCVTRARKIFDKSITMVNNASLITKIFHLPYAWNKQFSIFLLNLEQNLSRA